MTRKDYILLARALHAARPGPKSQDRFGWARCVQSVALTLMQDNPSFEYPRFIANCKGQPHMGIEPDEQ